jgi:hypothetical protein
MNNSPLYSLLSIWFARYVTSLAELEHAININKELRAQAVELSTQLSDLQKEVVTHTL